jgi:hypothetical protein
MLFSIVRELAELRISLMLKGSGCEASALRSVVINKETADCPVAIEGYRIVDIRKNLELVIVQHGFLNPPVAG